MRTASAISIMLALSMMLTGNIDSYAQGAKRWSVSGDTLYVYSGLTRQFSVDTPSDSGPVSTRISDSDLRDELKVLGISRPSTMVELHAAIPPVLEIDRPMVSAGIAQDFDIRFTAGQRTPAAKIEFLIPGEVKFDSDALTVNVIGRGDSHLADLGDVADVTIVPHTDGSKSIRLANVDLRPSNGADIVLSFHGALVKEPQTLEIRASYTTSEPEVLDSPRAFAKLTAVRGVTDLRKECDPDSRDLVLTWNQSAAKGRFRLMTSADEGKTWSKVKDFAVLDGKIHLTIPETGGWQVFKLKFRDHESNVVWHHPGRIDAGEMAEASGERDFTALLNDLIDATSRRGGGVINFSEGEYSVRTIYMKSDVWFHIDKGAVIKALPGLDEPELTWFSDRDYRSGLSPTDIGPYRDPENYLSKQDVGHTFFANTMFFGERIHNVRITGSGRITGNGNLATSDKVMNNEPGRRADKMFSFKLCNDIEIGGERRREDMWYDPATDSPVYLTGAGRDHECANMLHMDQAGHFVLLATGTDGIDIHDTYLGAASTGSVRDIYDFMGCSDVKVCNVYSVVGSDDIVKLGSDCSLGFTRKVSGYMIRNIVGDTNCNLFQIGSESADDIEDVYIDNIYVLGANKAGFSISSNDGARIRNIYLNSGKTGPLHSRSVMLRTKAPFFISISNRGRTLGAKVTRTAFTENGTTRDELLVTNSPIGTIENIHLEHIDISEVYAGSSYHKPRWAPYDGSQACVAPIFAGFALPTQNAAGENIKYEFPDGRTTGYIDGLYLKDINLTVKGGNPESDAHLVPPELGVGKYNVNDFKTLPAHGMWFRHVKNLVIEDCSITAEKPDGRPAVVFDDVMNKELSPSVIPYL